MTLGSKVFRYFTAMLLGQGGLKASGGVSGLGFYELEVVLLLEALGQGSFQLLLQSALSPCKLMPFIWL